MNKIIVCGMNGAGKSTLGKNLAKALGYKYMDIEDYYFPAKEIDYPYSIPRAQGEVSCLLSEDMRQHDNLVFSAVKGNYGEEIESMFTCAIFINIPKDIGMERVLNRSFQKFGNRILLGGDLHEKEKSFFDKIKKRTEGDIQDWVKSICVPVIHIDGTKPVDDNTVTIIRLLNDITPTDI